MTLANSLFGSSKSGETSRTASSSSQRDLSLGSPSSWADWIAGHDTHRAVSVGLTENTLYWELLRKDKPLRVGVFDKGWRSLAGPEDPWTNGESGKTTFTMHQDILQELSESPRYQRMICSGDSFDVGVKVEDGEWKALFRVAVNGDKNLDKQESDANEE